MATAKTKDAATADALNAICPYFTMFPLSFPAGILKRHASERSIVLDPFCGRGTTSFAARSLGLESYAIDVSPVAVAATRAKTAYTTPEAVVAEARRVLATYPAKELPRGDFWEYAYHSKTLAELCKLRQAVVSGDLDSDAGRALTGIILGALHGPLNKHTPSYFSNQCPRTYAPKPAYAVKFWRARGLSAPSVDLLSIIKVRAERYYSHRLKKKRAIIKLADSRESDAYDGISKKAEIIVTSPPYYGLRTYVADQWLRAWFLGGASFVEYSGATQIQHTSPEVFADNLTLVWTASAAACVPDAKMVIRFGAINDRPIDPSDLIKASLADTPWRIATIRSAGDAMHGKRQASTFMAMKSPKFSEIDVYCRLKG